MNRLKYPHSAISAPTITEVRCLCRSRAQHESLSREQMGPCGQGSTKIPGHLPARVHVVYMGLHWEGGGRGAWQACCGTHGTAGAAGRE
jgi:hypothetical protein